MTSPRDRYWTLSALLWGTLLVTALAAAPAYAAGPCCGIVGIDAANNLVIAKDNSSGRLFRFTVDALDIKSLRLNDKISVSPQTGKVSAINGVARSYAVTEVKSLAPPNKPGEPCCAEQEFQGVGVAADDVVIQLVELKRVGTDEVQATWTLRNKSKQDQRLTEGGSGWSDGYQLAYDATLQDLDTHVNFPVAKDTEGTPLSGKHPTAGPISGIVLKPGKTMTTWAKFLVPASTTTVDVTLPGAATPWNNVKITP